MRPDGLCAGPEKISRPVPALRLIADGIVDAVCSGRNTVQLGCEQRCHAQRRRVYAKRDRLQGSTQTRHRTESSCGRRWKEALSCDPNAIDEIVSRAGGRMLDGGGKKARNSLLREDARNHVHVDQLCVQTALYLKLNSA